MSHKSRVSRLASHLTFSSVSLFGIQSRCMAAIFRKCREDVQLARRAIPSLSVFRQISLYQSMICAPVHIFTSGLAAM